MLAILLIHILSRNHTPALQLSSILRAWPDFIETAVPSDLMFDSSGTILAVVGGGNGHAAVELFNNKWRLQFASRKPSRDVRKLLSFHRLRTGFDWWSVGFPSDFDTTKTVWLDQWPGGDRAKQVLVIPARDGKKKDVNYCELYSKRSGFMLGRSGVAIWNGSRSSVTWLSTSKGDTGCGIRHFFGEFIRWDQFFGVSKNIHKLLNDKTVKLLDQRWRINPYTSLAANPVSRSIISPDGLILSIPSGTVGLVSGWPKMASLVSSAESSPLILVGYTADSKGGTGYGRLPIDSIAFVDSRSKRVLDTVWCCEIKEGQYSVGGIALSPSGKYFAISVGHSIRVFKVPPLVLTQLSHFY